VAPPDLFFEALGGIDFTPFSKLMREQKSLSKQQLFMDYTTK